MTRKRRIERTDYRHFPVEYIDILQRFSRTGTYRAGPMTRRQANAMRREWYHYVSYLRNAPPDDDYARDLATIAGNMVWSGPNPDPVFIDGTCPDDAYFLDVYLNPLVAGIRREQAATGAETPTAPRHYLPPPSLARRPTANTPAWEEERLAALVASVLTSKRTEP
jgi:hypothetical protein